MLSMLSQEEDRELTEEDKVFLERLVQQIQEFNRNCKRKRGKKQEVEQNGEESWGESQEEREESVPRSTRSKEVLVKEKGAKEQEEAMHDKLTEPKEEFELFRNFSRESEVPLRRQSSGISLKHMERNVVEEERELEELDVLYEFEPEMKARLSSERDSMKPNEMISYLNRKDSLRPPEFLNHRLSRRDSSLSDSNLFRRASSRSW